MNELRHQINSQLKAGGSKGVQYKSFGNPHQLSNDHAAPQNVVNQTYNSSTKQSTKNINSMKSSKQNVGQVMKSSKVEINASKINQESLQMKINKKRVLSSNKNHITQADAPQKIPQQPGHYRIVSNPVNQYPQQSLTQVSQVAKNRKNLSSQQSQGNLRNMEGSSTQQVTHDANGNPTQQILKLRAAALVPPQSMMVNKQNDKDIKNPTQVNFPTSSSQIKKNAQRQNQQKMAQILANTNEAQNNIDSQITAQMIMGGLNTINDNNSRQEVHENNVGNVVAGPGSNKPGHNKALSMSSYVLQKPVPKSQMIDYINKNKNGTVALHQKSQSNFQGNLVVPNSFDARKTFHNNGSNNPNNTNSSMANLINNQKIGGTGVITKKKVAKPATMTSQQTKSSQNQQMQYVQNSQNYGNSTAQSHNYHRRILSQQNPLVDQSNVDQFLNQQQDMQSQQHLANSGKIVVINNNNTNINIHHQSPYPGQNSQYPNNKQPMHKKNTQSFHIPTQSQSHLRGEDKTGNIGSLGSGQKPYGMNTNYKAYTQANQSIKSSINNSINHGIGNMSSGLHENINQQFGINYINEEDLKQGSNIDSAQLLPKSQKNLKKMQSNIQMYNQRKQIKRVKLDTWVKNSSGGNTNNTSIPPQQNQTSLNTQMKYPQAGAITSVGSASSIGPDKFLVSNSAIGSRIKTRGTSGTQNKSATRGKSGNSNQRDKMIKPATSKIDQQYNHMKMGSKNMSINTSKQDQQIQMHQGDISSSNFLNSERSSLQNFNKVAAQQQMTVDLRNQPDNNQNATTIQYQNPNSQGNYLQMFHNTEDNRRPKAFVDQANIKQQSTAQKNPANMNTLESNQKMNHVNQYPNQQKQKKSMHQYFNIGNSASQSNVTSAGGKRELSNGQKHLKMILNSQNQQKNANMSPTQDKQYVYIDNDKGKNPGIQHNRGNSVNLPSEYIKQGAMAKNKVAGHRKIESHDSVAMEQLRNRPQIYGDRYSKIESDKNSYMNAGSNYDKMTNNNNSENIHSDKHSMNINEIISKGENNHSGINSSQLSNRQKIQCIEKSVPVHEISLQATIEESAISYDNKMKIGKVIRSPQKQPIASVVSHKSPQAQKQTFSQSPKIKKVIKEKPSPRQKKQGGKSASSQIVSGPLTPKKLIFNGILSNISSKLFDTKIEYYKIGKVIGKGAFGKVNLAIHRLTGKFVALKSINKTFMSDESSLKKVRQEYNILKRARHQNIVRLYESFEIDSHIVYVMEVCGGGDLLTYVRRRRKLKEDFAKFVFRQIIEGLQYVHSKGVLHRDIKLDNILLTSEGDVKICDFGVSKLVSNKNQMQTEQCGTPAYIAPEVFRGKGYKGFQSDVWSAGVVLYAMLYGTVPFKATNMHELQTQIINLQCSWGAPGEISASALTMLKKVLEVDPSKRLTPIQILQEPWMQLTEKQLSQVEVFSQIEKQKIIDEFLYYNEKQEDKNEDPFLEQELQTTQNSDFKNNTTKSIILAPFNSTRSHISENYMENEGITPLIMPKDVLAFADKCKEVNRQYMLNNNAELDNGVYNDNEEEEEKVEEKQDNLVGLNMQLDNKNPIQPGTPPPRENGSRFESQQLTAVQSLNTSQIILDEDKIDRVCDKFGYQFNYLREVLENDELNHATTTYFLEDQQKEF